MANALFPDGPAAGEVPGADPIRMLFIGDCAVSGYGVLNHGLAVVSQTARFVASDHNRGCSWTTITDPELTAIRSAKALGGATMDIKFDVVVVLLGPPDVLVGTAAHEWAASLSRVVELVRKTPDANCPVVLAAIPPMYRFRPMPDFVRRILMLQTHRLNRASRSVSDTHPKVSYSHFPPIGADGEYIMEQLSWRTIHSLWGRQLGKDVSLAVSSVGRER
ncbi:SGNH/GDSL hydrolase family protein [Rhodoglobus aureus]